MNNVIDSKERWALLWEQTTRLDGYDRHLIHENCEAKLFRSRSAARAFAKEKYGYIKTRPDLRSEPHCWRMPKPVRVTINFVLAANMRDRFAKGRIRVHRSAA